MNVGIVGPSPVPYTQGGMEIFLWNLCDSINQKSIHKAEIIKLPCKENDFWSLLESYYRFYKLDLSHFDVVICTKYPAWMVRHNNCIYYMCHCLRGLYDTYHLTGLPKKTERGNKNIDRVLDYIESNPLPDNFDCFFDMLFELKEIPGIPDRFFTHPGSFIRDIIHYLDKGAMSRPYNSRFSFS